MVCHDADVAEGGLDLEALSRDLDDQDDLWRWIRVLDRVRLHKMARARLPPTSSTALPAVGNEKGNPKQLNFSDLHIIQPLLSTASTIFRLLEPSSYKQGKKTCQIPHPNAPFWEELTPIPQ